VPDILWGQLYRTQRSLRNLLRQNDFSLINDAVWSDEGHLNLLVCELEERFLPQSKKHLGPPVEKRRPSEDFLRKHLTSSSTLSGPCLENDRWIAYIKRKHTDAVELLRKSLKTDGRQVGVPRSISRAMTKSLRILVNEEILKIYLKNGSFAKFMTEYINGKPRWLQS
jgi:tRNA nucleotidyltransferase (CCA-adding enzyme)